MDKDRGGEDRRREDRRREDWRKEERRGEERRGEEGRRERRNSGAVFGAERVKWEYVCPRTANPETLQ